MNYYHLDNPDAYYECFDKEIKHYVALMSKLDTAIIDANLSFPGKSKDLFDMVDAMIYSVEKRYRREHNIEEEDRGLYFSDVTEGKLIDNMRNMLREEVTNYFSHVAAIAND
jgi:hypothetical protein